MHTNPNSFACFNKHGFQLTFDNGWTASVMWGQYNYAIEQKYCPKKDCQTAATAEVACWPKNGRLTDIWDHGDTVKGDLTANEVAAFLTQVAAFK